MDNWVCFGVAFGAAGPFLAVSEIKTGIVERDSVKLSQNIEFPMLRQNLKEQLNTAVMRKASAEAKDNPWALLATGFATKMVDGVVDSFVTRQVQQGRTHATD